MSFTIGNAQKLVSIAVKHAWCHGLLLSAPDSAPVDRYVLGAAYRQLRNAGQQFSALSTSWSSMDLYQYRNAWQLVSQAATLCNLSVAEWELRVFQPGNGATPLVVGAPLGPLALAQAQFLTSNRFAANPGAPLVNIARCAGKDARHAAYLMGARPYDLSRAAINAEYPGQFDLFKHESETEAWRVASNFIKRPTLATRPRFENALVGLVSYMRSRYPFV